MHGQKSFYLKTKKWQFFLNTHPITAPRSCPIIETEFDPIDLISCNSSSHMIYGVYSFRQSGLSESLKPFKSSATTWKKRDSSLICKIYNLKKRKLSNTLEEVLCGVFCHKTNTCLKILMITWLRQPSQQSGNPCNSKINGSFWFPASI